MTMDLKTKYSDVIEDLGNFIDNHGDLNYPKEYIALEEIMGDVYVYEDLSEEQFKQAKELLASIPKQNKPDLDDLWNDGDMDPAGGYGPHSHI